MGNLTCEARRVAAQHRDAYVGVKNVVGCGDGLKQPFAEEARATRDEEAGVGKPRPDVDRVLQDVPPVSVGNGRQYAGQKPTPRNSEIRPAAWSSISVVSPG